jgi:uncharacterized protein (DUF924 family)
MDIASSQDVLEYWFSPEQSPRWYAADDKLDADIRRRFLATYEAACSGDLNEWRNTPQSLLALIIVLDQFPRNMFRGSARSFAADARAAALTKEGIEKGFDRSLRPTEQDFFYMPLMHSERLSDHDLLITLGRGEDRYARRHREIIVRFGRFPHRNETLGRETTAEEALFLAGPDSR